MHDTPHVEQENVVVFSDVLNAVDEGKGLAMLTMLTIAVIAGRLRKCVGKRWKYQT
jgi:hypothetical protein